MGVPHMLLLDLARRTAISRPPPMPVQRDRLENAARLATDVTQLDFSQFSYRVIFVTS